MIELFLSKEEYASDILVQLLENYIGLYDNVRDENGYLLYRRVSQTNFDSYIGGCSPTDDPSVFASYGDDAVIFHAITQEGDKLMLLKLLRQLIKKEQDLKRIGWMKRDLSSFFHFTVKENN